MSLYDKVCCTVLVCFLLIGIDSQTIAKEANSTSQPAMIWPRKIRPGDTIMFVASASPLSRDSIMVTKGRLEKRGYKVKLDEAMFSEYGFLAGTDERRAEELMRAFQDKEVDAIFSGRGGYGVMRILDSLDYDVIRENPKVLTGYSDITALHLAINKKAGLVTFHSPNGVWGADDAPNLPAFAEEYFYKALQQPEGDDQGYVIKPSQEVPQPEGIGKGKARGRLTGGNLSLVVSLMGTPYEIDTTDAILMIEDTREAPYRVDRMLCQLKLAGKLDTLKGAVLGQFTENYDREKDQMTEDERFSVTGVLRQYFEPLNIPVLINYPIGHHPANAAVPMGGMVKSTLMRQR